MIAERRIYGWDEKEANVGGGRVYGEYNKGPYKVLNLTGMNQVGNPISNNQNYLAGSSKILLIKGN